RDAPVRLALELSEVRALVLDPRQLFSRAELAPADAQLVVKHQRGVRPAVHHPRVLVCPVSLRRGLAPEALLGDANAPPAAHAAAVALDARREVGPRRLIQGPRAHNRHDGCANLPSVRLSASPGAEDAPSPRPARRSRPWPSTHSSPTRASTTAS